MIAVALAQRATLTATRQQTLFLTFATFATKSSSSSGPTLTTDDGGDCPIRTFAITNPKLARQILSVPSISNIPLADDTNGSNGNPILHGRRGKKVASRTLSLEAYLDWRNWDIKSILQRNKFDYDDDDTHQLAVGLLSHTLTFPLTLGHYFGRNIYIGNSIYDESFSSRKKLRIIRRDGVLRLCCVGARAECTLPNNYWKEFLLVLACIRTGGTGTIESTQQRQQQQKYIRECIIDFVGPDVPHHLVSRTIDLSLTESSNTRNSNDDDVDDDDDVNNLNYRLTMNYHPSYLHECLLKYRKTILGVTADDNSYIDNPLPPPWDGYVLFNPGLGHANLKSQWYKTLLFILRTGKPILLTAHSLHDAERDGTVLEKMLIEDVNGQYCIRNVLPFTTYVENPYASRMRYVDPFPSTANIAAKAKTITTTTDTNGIHHDIVRPNQYALFLP